MIRESKCWTTGSKGCLKLIIPISSTLIKVLESHRFGPRIGVGGVGAGHQPPAAYLNWSWGRRPPHGAASPNTPAARWVLYRAGCASQIFQHRMKIQSYFPSSWCLARLSCLLMKMAEDRPRTLVFSFLMYPDCSCHGLVQNKYHYLLRRPRRATRNVYRVKWTWRRHRSCS